MVVIQGVVPGGPVIPHRDRVLAPAKAAGEFGSAAMLVKIVKKRLGFFFSPAVKAQSELRIDIKCRTARQWMSNDNRVIRILTGRSRVTEPITDIRFVTPVLIGLGTKYIAAGMNRPKGAQHLLETLRETVVGRIHAGEHRVPA